jgi:hypothetical protein
MKEHVELEGQVGNSMPERGNEVAPSRAWEESTYIEARYAPCTSEFFELNQLLVNPTS